MLGRVRVQVNAQEILAAACFRYLADGRASGDGAMLVPAEQRRKFLT